MATTATSARKREMTAPESFERLMRLVGDDAEVLTALLVLSDRMVARKRRRKGGSRGERR